MIDVQPTPDERDITKMQLWERINAVLDTVAMVGRNMADNIALALPAIQRQNDASFLDFKNTLKDAIDDMQQFVNVQVKFLEKMNNDAFTNQINSGNKLRADVEARFQSLKENMESEMSGKISDAFTQISVSIKNYTDTVTDYKKDSADQMSVIQQEMGAKLGEISASFNLMKTKFQKISEQLQ